MSEQPVKNRKLEKTFILFSFLASVCEGEWQRKVEDAVPDYDHKGSQAVIEQLASYHDDENDTRTYELFSEIMNELYGQIKPYIGGKVDADCSESN